MKSVKMLGIVLLSIFISTVCALAFEIEREGSSIIITNQDPQIELILSKGSGTLNLDLKTAYITLHTSRSVGEEKFIFVRGTSNATGEIIFLSDREYSIFSMLMVRLDFSQWPEEYSSFLYSSLNVLESWPPSAPVFTVIDDEKILHYRPNGKLGIIPNQIGATTDEYICPPGRELNFPTPEYEDLCDKKGELVEGNILYLGEWYWNLDQEAWTEPFTRYVESDPCFGRCGKGCPEDLTGRIVYTQRCFNHDGCVKENGYFAENCNAMFYGAVEDYFKGPICYEIWVSACSRK